jgi:hypothetical protein
VSIPPLVDERWLALVQAVRAEFWGAGQDPNDALYSNHELRVLRGGLTDPPADEEWFTVTLSEAELAERPHAELAREFYQRYRAARDRRAG